MDSVLSVERLTKVYRMGEVEAPALRGIDLALRAGELVVLLGASGSGKSTLLNIMGGLDLPSAGRALYGEQDLTTASERALTVYRRDHVGSVFQFYNLIPSLTARENVARVTDLARRPLSPKEALELVGLGHRLDHYPAQLSGGEQQRVAIARAITKCPRVAPVRRADGRAGPGHGQRLSCARSPTPTGSWGRRRWSSRTTRPSRPCRTGSCS
jgi:putative ABC transport system ATP-binding protein